MGQGAAKVTSVMARASGDNLRDYLPDRYSSLTEQCLALKPQLWLTPLH